MEETQTQHSKHAETKELSLPALIEALLFYFAEPLSLKKLSQLTKWDVPAVETALCELQKNIDARNSGVVLIVHNNEASLGTAPEASAIIEALAKEELSKELSKATLETLSVVCYKGPLTRSDIDYVRGVNSTFILRNLQMRGIVEKLDNPQDSRASLYAPTMQALQYMGVSRREDLPRFEEVQTQLSQFLADRSPDDVVKLTETPPPIGEDSAEDEAVVCDTNNDGVLTAEECAVTETLQSFESEDDLAVDADIREEDLMGSEFVDEEVVSHLHNDERNIQ